MLLEIGETLGKTPAQVTFRWLIQQEKVAAIPKAAREDHLKSNFDVFDFKPRDEEMKRIFKLHHYSGLQWSRTMRPSVHQYLPKSSSERG